MKKEFENNKKNALGNNPDLRDDIDDEMFQKILREEFIEREKQIEEALFADKDVENLVFTDEEVKDSYQELLRRFEREKQENAEHEASDSKIIEIKSRKTGVRWHQLGKVVGMAAVALACIFAASMTSEANRKYLVNSVRILSGNDSQFISYNDDSNENASTKESDAIADIEEKLGVKMPEFYYRPYGMEYMTYEIRERTSFSKIEYEYKDNILLFYIDKQNKDVASDISSLNGMEKIIDTIERDETDIIIKELRDEEDESFTYAANWTYEGTSYTLSGKIELDELKKIVKEMKF